MAVLCPVCVVCEPSARSERHSPAVQPHLKGGGSSVLSCRFSGLQESRRQDLLPGMRQSCSPCPTLVDVGPSSSHRSRPLPPPAGSPGGPQPLCLGSQQLCCCCHIPVSSPAPQVGIDARGKAHPELPQGQTWGGPGQWASSQPVPPSAQCSCRWSGVTLGMGGGRCEKAWAWAFCLQPPWWDSRGLERDTVQVSGGRKAWGPVQDPDSNRSQGPSSPCFALIWGR